MPFHLNRWFPKRIQSDTGPTFLRQLLSLPLFVLQIVGHEGSVERNFSHQKLVHAPLRAILAPEAVQVQMFKRFNGPLIKNRTNNC